MDEGDRVFSTGGGTASIVLEFPSFRDFVQSYSGSISERGMFVKNADVARSQAFAVGDRVDFEVRLKDDFRLMQGKGKVVWLGAGDTTGDDAGTALEFLELDDPSRRLITRLIENHTKEGGQVFSLRALIGASAAAEPATPEPFGSGSADDLFRLAPEAEAEIQPAVESAADSETVFDQPVGLETIAIPTGIGWMAEAPDASDTVAESGDREVLESDAAEPGSFELIEAEAADQEAELASEADSGHRNSATEPEEQDRSTPWESASAQVAGDSLEPAVEEAPGQTLDALELLDAGEGEEFEVLARPDQEELPLDPAPGTAAAGLDTAASEPSPQLDPPDLLAPLEPAPPALEVSDLGDSPALELEEPGTDPGASSSTDPLAAMLAAEAARFDRQEAAGAKPDLAPAGTEDLVSAGEPASLDIPPAVDPLDPPPALDRPGGTDPMAADASGSSSSIGLPKPVVPHDVARMATELSTVPDVEMPDEDDLTGVDLAGSASASGERGWGTRIALLALFGLALGALYYVYGDVIRARLGLGGETVAAAPAALPEGAPPEGEVMAATETGDEGRGAGSTGAGSSDGTGTGIAAESEGAEPVDGSEDSVAAAETVSGSEESATEPAASVAAEDDVAAAPPAQDRAGGLQATVVESIRWSREGRSTVVTIRLNAPISTAYFEVERIRQGAPREVIKIRGIERPYSAGVVPVGTDQVRQLRTGLHQSDSGSALHVVADLAGPAVAVLSVEPHERELRIVFS